MKKINIADFGRSEDVVKTIGIEFEGLFTQEVLEVVRRLHIKAYDTSQYNKLPKRLIELSLLIRDVGGDGSIQGMTDRYFPAEMRSLVYDNRTDLEKVLTIFSWLNEKKYYLINDSIGLHYHIGVPENMYRLLAREEFYKNYLDMFRKTAEIVYFDRLRNRYCRTPDFETLGNYRKRLFSFRDTRYRPINYQSFREFKTCEFRMYGGKYANFCQFAIVISNTIKLINSLKDTSETCKRYILSRPPVESEKVININI